MSKIVPKDRVIAKAKDKDGNVLEIWDSQSIGMSPVCSFYLRHSAQLIDNHHALQVMSGSNNSSAVYATQDGVVVGAIVYEIHATQRMLYILLSCVEETHRGKGVYTALHPWLEKIAKDEGCNRIGSIVHVNNKVRQASCAKVGIVPEFIRMVKEL